MNDQGILLVAYGPQKYHDELEVCKARIEQVWPDVAIHVVQSDKESHPKMLARIEAMLKCPFKRTMFMDTDCYQVEPVPELFDLLDRFDLAVPHAVYREVYPVDVPAAFIEHSPGLMVWERNRVTWDLLADWKRRFLRDHKTRSDERKVSWFPSQPSFREALYYSKARFCVLPTEYHWTGIGYVQGPVKLVHKRPNASGEAERINKDAGQQRVAIIWDEPVVMEW